MSVRPFGEVGREAVREIALALPGGMAAKVITWGAVLRDLIVPAAGASQRVVLGLERLEDYVRHSPSFGAVPGRYANRIGGARFVLDGREHRLVPNEGANQLHGGPNGFGLRVWSLLDHDARSVELGLVSPDGEAGYPGRLLATCRYELVEPATLRIVLAATADAPTPVNLTTHSYYNLDGSPDIRDHVVQVRADHVTPAGPGDIPTGAVAPVAGTRFDHREPRALRGDGAYEDLDINYVLRRGRASAPALAPDLLAQAATVMSARNGLAMDLWTTEPGLQVYDGHKVDMPVPGHEGARYGRYAGLALEPQRFPDGPNHAHFPPCILRPGDISRQTSEMRFRPG